MMGMDLGAPGGRARAALRAGRVSAYSMSAFWKSSVVVMPMLNASCWRVATPCPCPEVLLTHSYPASSDHVSSLLRRTLDHRKGAEANKEGCLQTSECVQTCKGVTRKTDLGTQIGCKQPRGQALPKGHQTVLCPGCQLLRIQRYSIQPLASLSMCRREPRLRSCQDHYAPGAPWECCKRTAGARYKAPTGLRTAESLTSKAVTLQIGVTP